LNKQAPVKLDKKSPEKRKRSKSVVTINYTVENFGHDKRSNLPRKIRELRSKSERADISPKTSEESNISELQRKIKELQAILN
jgi:polyhydroxyalkanoate synthesis regulator phasin